MFNGLGWEEVLLIAIVGLVVFGPERLPKAAADLGRLIRQLRQMAQGAANDLRSELGPGMADVDLRTLNPRRFVENALFGDDEPATATPGAASASAASVALADNERPPYDDDAT